MYWLNIIISWIWQKIPTTDTKVEYKQHLNDVALCTIRYSCRLSTQRTTLLFTESVNSTNITVHILQCVTVMNLDTLQHFPSRSTSSPLAHTRLHLTNGLIWLKGRPCVDALRYLHVYRISTVWILVSDGGEIGVHIYIFIIIQRTLICNLNVVKCGAVGWGTAFQVECLEFESNPNECQGCHLVTKVTV